LNWEERIDLGRGGRSRSPPSAGVGSERMIDTERGKSPLRLECGREGRPPSSTVKGKGDKQNVDGIKREREGG